MKLSTLCIVPSKAAVLEIPPGKKLINTVNAHSFNVAQKDKAFAEALTHGDYLLPDGASIVIACRWLKGCVSHPLERVAGWDFFELEMQRLNERGGRCMFMGSSEQVLAKIKEQAANKYPSVEVTTYSPPYKAEFTQEENEAIVQAINSAHPDLLWIGMTAPKQEKWAWQHWSELDIDCHVGTIGAVFDFFAGTSRRAPRWWQEHSLEWLYRLCMEPGRMWRRYILGNPLFLYHVMREKLTGNP